MALRTRQFSPGSCFEPVDGQRGFHDWGHMFSHHVRRLGMRQYFWPFARTLAASAVIGGDFYVVGGHDGNTVYTDAFRLTLDPSLGPHKAAVALLGPLATIGEHLDMLRALVAHTMDVPSLYLASPAAGFAATFSAPPLFVSTVGAWLKAGMLSGTRGRGGAATARLLERVWSFQAAASSRLRSSQASEPAMDGEHDVGAGGVAMSGSGSGGAAGSVRRIGPRNATELVAMLLCG